MLRTGIPVSVWDQEDQAVIHTAVELLTEDQGPINGGEVIVSG